MDVPSTQCCEDILLVVKITTQMPVICTEEQIVDDPGPQVHEGILAQMPVNCTEAQIVDMPVAQCQEDSVQVIIVVPQARIPERSVEPIKEKVVKVAQIMDATVSPQKRISEGLEPTKEENMKVITIISKERISERIFGSPFASSRKLLR